MGLLNGIKNIASSTKKAVKKVLEIKADTLYNYDDKSSREETVSYLVLYADGQRQDQIRIWQMCENYYNNEHDAQLELTQYCKEKNIPWVPAIIPDPFIHVESQVNAELPDFEFSGRDDDLDSKKAETRQFVCQYVLDQNEMLMKNNRNQRRLGKYGNEVWKVGYDYNLERPNNIHGDIFIHDVDPRYMIIDPVAVDIDDAEYVAYVYDIHRMKAARLFKNELKKIGKTIDEISNGTLINTPTYNTQSHDPQHDIVQVVEFWYRQPKEGSEKYTYNENGREISGVVDWEAGDIACTIQINTTELKYIPKYWLKTSGQNKMYPYTVGYKIPLENKFWGLSELKQIKELVDAADRELAITVLNDAFTANDIIVMGETCMAPGSDPLNEPGAIWKIKDGAASPPKRLEGLSNTKQGIKDTINFIRDIIKQVIGNFDVNMGDAPPGNVRTLGGLIQLKEQGNTRQNKKKAGSVAMWERLIKLIDYTAIEFYDDNRLIFIGAEKSKKTMPVENEDGTVTDEKVPVRFEYNSDTMKVYDDLSNQYYYPTIDYTINVGDGISNSPSLTVQATEDLMQKPINESNYELAKSIVDIMNLPNKKVIKDNWDKLFNKPAAPVNQPAPAQGQPINPEQIPGSPISLQKEKPQLNQGGQPQEQPVNVDMLLQGLDDNEKQHLLENPELLAQFVQQTSGGG